MNNDDMTGLFWKLYSRYPGFPASPCWWWVGSETSYGRAIITAREIARLHNVQVTVWSTDTGGRGVPVHMVYRAGTDWL